MKYSDLLREHAALAIPAATPCRVAVLANITIDSLRQVLEFSLRSRGVAATVTIGDYDNIAQDSERFRDHDAVFVFYELAAIVDKFPFELHRFDPAMLDALVQKAKRELAFTFEALAASRLVIFNLLSATPFTLNSQAATPLERMCQEINDFVRASAPRSFRLVNLEKLFARCSVERSIDLRFYLSSRALYKYEFLHAYSEFVSPIVGATVGHYKKVLALDCDNTLWKGILGEDGLRGVRMFSEVQSIFVQLADAGVLVCLCSKNNAADVDAALHDERMVLTDRHIVVKAVNWSDKADNLAQIAETLNLGLDSFVFVDDRDFELERVRQRHPMVTTFKVPANYSDFIWLCQSIAGLFYREGDIAEDRAKVSQYRSEFARREQRTRFEGIEDYLASLQLSIKLSVNRVDLVPRLAQLTQKTNQFNLTTRRMTESELLDANNSSDHVVLGVGVSDKFGAYGTTGMIVTRQENGAAHVENFLLSCRVIGRGIEFKAFDCLMELMRSRGVEEMFALYRPTPKNAQVKDLYTKLGFTLASEQDGALHFRMRVAAYKSSNIGYIEVENA